MTTTTMRTVAQRTSMVAYCLVEIGIRRGCDCGALLLTSGEQYALVDSTEHGTRAIDFRLLITDNKVSSLETTSRRV